MIIIDIKLSSLLAQSSQPDPLELQRQQEARRRALARKRAREQFKPRSPEPVEGRKHIDVQTELYLEEITGKLSNTIYIERENNHGKLLLMIIMGLAIFGIECHSVFILLFLLFWGILKTYSFLHSLDTASCKHSRLIPLVLKVAASSIRC